MLVFEIVKVRPEDDCEISEIIRQVGAEYGAIGDGFGPSDAEVAAMSAHYRDQDGSLYLVAKVAGKVVGGCGIAPFDRGRQVCELKKLFLLKDSRGFGIGKALANQCLDHATQQGYQACYLDTLATMTEAIALYEKLGFAHLDRPLEGTIHGGCDVWMLKKLQ